MRERFVCGYWIMVSVERLWKNNKGTKGDQYRCKKAALVDKGCMTAESWSPTLLTACPPPRSKPEAELNFKSNEAWSLILLERVGVGQYWIPHQKAG